MYSYFAKGTFLSVVFSVCVVGAAVAAPTDCGENYYSSEAPDITNENLKVRVVELCHDGFGVMHSGVTATPLWSAQYLTAQRVYDAKKIDRIDKFYAEPRLKASERSELSHYSRSGYDRGHLAPSADMSSANSQANSFSLSNIIPQQPDLNRKLWAEIEATTRGLALSYGDVYVVTGVGFHGQNLKALKGRVIVPTAVYKAVYIPSVNAAAVWWAPNEAPGDQYEVISVDELKKRVSVDVFPGISQEVKAVAVNLPKPSRFADRSANAPKSSSRNVQASPSDVQGSSPLKEIGKRVLLDVMKGVLK